MCPSIQLTQILRAKEQAAEESKNNYILQLENTNLKRRLHYNSEMPQVFQVHALFLPSPIFFSPYPLLPLFSLSPSLSPLTPTPPLPLHPLSPSLFFHSLPLPSLSLQNLQEMNAKRMEKYSSLISQCAECNRRVFPVVNTCLDNIVQGSAAVDATKVCPLTRCVCS